MEFGFFFLNDSEFVESLQRKIGPKDVLLYWVQLYGAEDFIFKQVNYTSNYS